MAGVSQSFPIVRTDISLDQKYALEGDRTGELEEKVEQEGGGQLRPFCKSR